MLALTKPWHHTNRIVCANSAFSSVTTALHLAKAGLGYIGMVKTATKYYPMEALLLTTLTMKEQYAGMVTEIEDWKFLAYVWCDRDCCYFIATHGSLKPGISFKRTRWRTVDGSQDVREAL